ncbi:MAG: RNA-guided pseudouridylation complex pseudouridine synthase subunit Cbf5 [Methanomicrobiales archaeon]|nr:RNA-guided pseudouridylation complex pseudouridine synthase subunit Cbf5 [Methanomicrobiales archaeon]
MKEGDRLVDAGILILDKPRGPTSHQVAAWAADILGAPVGHAGTLDPQVSGVLVVMIGPAVRLAPLLLSSDKEYVCCMRLHGDVPQDRVEAVAREFTGRIYQRPPRKSAVKRNLRIRTIHSIEILDREGRSVLFRVACDAGTYIRLLCHHMGLALGVGAHMQELRRTRSGSYTEDASHTLHDLQDAAVYARGGDRTALDAMILPVETAAAGIPKVVVRDTAVDAICHGAALAAVGVVQADPFGKGDAVAIFSRRGEFVALGTALVDASAFTPGAPGLVVQPRAVMMRPGTYARGWRTRGERAGR